MPNLKTIFSSSIEDRNLIREYWDTLSRLPKGNVAFSKLIGRMARYSGSIPFKVESLEQGACRVSMKDTPRVRNHLRSLHAIALVNVAELAGNLAAAYTMPDDARFIVAGLSIDYLKKARGTVSAEATVPPIESNEKHEIQVPVTIFNEAREIVAEAVLRTLIGPVKARG